MGLTEKQLADIRGNIRIYDNRVAERDVTALLSEIDRLVAESKACPLVHCRCGACGIAISEDGKCGCADIQHPIGRFERDRVSRLRKLCDKNGIDTTNLYGE